MRYFSLTGQRAIPTARIAHVVRHLYPTRPRFRVNSTVAPRECGIGQLCSKNKWCSEGPYRVLHVVPNTGPYSVLQGIPIEGASKDSHGTMQSTPHKVLASTPIVSLEHPVLTCRRLIYYDLWGPSGHLF